MELLYSSVTSLYHALGHHDMPIAGRRRGSKVKGIQFTLMVVGAYLQFARGLYSLHGMFSGAAGTGRTTFVNTLCNTEVLAHKVIDGPEIANVEAVLSIKPVNTGEFVHWCRDGLLDGDLIQCLELEEEGVRISLTVVDTPGFGDNIDNEHTFVPFFVYVEWLVTVDTLHSFQEIVTYLERQYDDILAEQSRIKRNPRFRDSRVHALLYFIPPTGHSYVFHRICIYFCKF